MRSSHKAITVAVLMVSALFVYQVLRKLPTNSIQITHNPSHETLREKGVAHWYTWAKEPSEFFWQYSVAETAYILEGEVYLTPEGATEAVLLQRGDLVEFAAGLRCHWRVTKPVRKQVLLEQNLFGKWLWKGTFMLKAIPRFFSAGFPIHLSA